MDSEVINFEGVNQAHDIITVVKQLYKNPEYSTVFKLCLNGVDKKKPYNSFKMKSGATLKVYLSSRISITDILQIIDSFEKSYIVTTDTEQIAKVDINLFDQLNRLLPECSQWKSLPKKELEKEIKRKPLTDKAQAQRDKVANILKRLS